MEGGREGVESGVGAWMEGGREGVESGVGAGMEVCRHGRGERKVELFNSKQTFISSNCLSHTHTHTHTHT